MTTGILISLILSGCGSGANSLSQWGFPLNNSSIIIDETPWNLKGEEKFVKAKLTLTQAQTLRKAFASIPASKVFFVPIAPKDIQPLSGNAQWTPQRVKKYWSGSFDKQEGSSIFYCQYIFDTKNTNNIILYFYAITSDD